MMMRHSDLWMIMAMTGHDPIDYYQITPDMVELFNDYYKEFGIKFDEKSVAGVLGHLVLKCDYKDGDEKISFENNCVLAGGVVDFGDPHVGVIEINEEMRKQLVFYYEILRRLADEPGHGLNLEPACSLIEKGHGSNG